MLSKLFVPEVCGAVLTGTLPPGAVSGLAAGKPAGRAGGCSVLAGIQLLTTCPHLLFHLEVQNGPCYS